MNSVKIVFLGNEYVIKTDADEEYVKRLSNYLDEKVKEIAPSLGNAKIPLPLFLATLKVADDMFRLKSEYEEYKNSAEEKTRRLVGLLESSLAEDETEELDTDKATQDTDDGNNTETFEGWS